MKTTWILIIVLIVVVAAGYVERHQIKSLLGGSSSSPSYTMQPTPTMAPSPTVSSSSANIIMTKTDATKGAYVTDTKGMTLYIFDKDQPGVSNCYNACATTWPPYLAGSTPQASMPANVTTVKRTDGAMQYAYKNMPLYYYAKDKQPGDLLGDGVGGIWHILKP